MDLREHDNVVECIEWAPDSAIENIQKGANLDSKNKSGPFLVSGSRDKTIKVRFSFFFSLTKMGSKMDQNWIQPNDYF